MFACTVRPQSILQIVADSIWSTLLVAALSMPAFGNDPASTEKRTGGHEVMWGTHKMYAKEIEPGTAWLETPDTSENRIWVRAQGCNAGRGTVTMYLGNHEEPFALDWNGRRVWWNPFAKVTDFDRLVVNVFCKSIGYEVR